MRHVVSGLIGLLAGGCCVLAAEDSVIAQTNYYTVSGSTARELREEIERKRPWKPPGDGLTFWKIDWSFRTMASDSDCRLRSLEVKTRVTVTLPRWITPTDADDLLKERWNRYMKGLLA